MLWVTFTWFSVSVFVKRSNDDYGKSTKQFLRDTFTSTSKLIQNEVESIPQYSEEVSLAEYDSGAEDKVLQAIIYPHSKMPLSQIQEIVKNMPRDKRNELLKSYMSKR